MYKFDVMYVMEDGKKQFGTVEADTLEEARKKTAKGGKKKVLFAAVTMDPELVRQLKEDAK